MAVELKGRTIGLATDHAAWELKLALAAWFRERGCVVRDFGCHGPESCDYPVAIYPCVRALARGECDLAVVACGSGIGASIVANKVPGVRAALCLEEEQGSLSRQHNNANCLVLSARLRSEEQNLRILQHWLEAEFEGGRHTRRVELIHQGELIGRDTWLTEDAAGKEQV